MSRPPVIPAPLRTGPFHVREALDLGVSHRRLAGRAFRRILPAVWVCVEYEMTEADWWSAAAKYAPDDARFTGATRLQQLGLDLGPHRPLQMVVGRDLHRESPEVFIHRTTVMPEHDDAAVSTTATFVEICRWFSLLDAVATGDWMLAHGHLDLEALHHFCERDEWREGTAEALWVSSLLDGRSRSVPESHTRLHFQAAGLPQPELNPPVEVGNGVVLRPDWWWRLLRVAAEYEGGQHQSDRGQYLADIDRYRLYRTGDIGYCQITREMLASPRSVVRRMDQTLRIHGYDGPQPEFGVRFAALRRPVAEARAMAPDLRTAWAEV